MAAGVWITGLAMYIACSSASLLGHPSQPGLEQQKKVTLLEAAPSPSPHALRCPLSFLPQRRCLFYRLATRVLFFLLVLYIADNHTLGQHMVDTVRCVLEAKFVTGIKTCSQRELIPEPKATMILMSQSMLIK